MGKWNLSFGHLEGTTSNSKLVSSQFETSTKGLLILLGNLDLSAFVYETANGTSLILGPLAAGVINGACYTLLIRSSGSSGGTDFVAALIHRSRPEMSFFWITFSLNVMVAISSYFVYDFEMEPVILCILYSFMSSTVSDSLMKSVRGAVRLEIVNAVAKATGLGTDRITVLKME